MSISNKPGENAGEASMDEILASIRKIIADDPSAPVGGKDARSINPLVENASAPGRSGDPAEGGRPLLPPAARFDDSLLRAGPDPRPAAPPLRGRPFADNALADFYDAELNDDCAAQLQPPPPPLAGTADGSADGLAPPAVPANMDPGMANRLMPAPAAGGHDPWAAWRNLRAASAPGATPPELPKAAPQGVTVTKAPQLADPAEATSKLVVQERVSGATPSHLNGQIDRQSEAKSGTKSGTTSENRDTPPVLEPKAAPQPAPVAVAVAAPATPGDQLSTEIPKAPTVNTTMPPVKPGFYPPKAANTVRRQPASFSSVFPRINGAAPPGINDDVPPSAVEPSAIASPETSSGGSLRSAAQPAPQTMTSGPAAVVPVNEQRPAALQQPPLNAGRPNGTVPAADPTAVAAGIALEKLAAGLSEAPVMPAPVKSAPTLPVDPAPPAHSGATAKHPPQPASAPATRTLDDMVSDLLRPMLEKWVESNMPRLMEKALRPGAPKEPGPPKP